MATLFRARRLSADNPRDHEFGALKAQWREKSSGARMPFGALDPNSSVSYPGGAGGGVKKARRAVSAPKPFVKPPPLDKELLVGADPLPGLRSPGKASPRRESLAPAACARTRGV